MVENKKIKNPLEEDKNGYGYFAKTMNYNNYLSNNNSPVKITVGETPVNDLGEPAPSNGMPDLSAVGGTGTTEALGNTNGTETGAITGGTETGGTESTGTNTVAGAGTVLGTGYVPTITGTMKDEATFISELGVDLDKEYEEGKAALEYDFMTSQANFGERAEQLAQMGLSNSGVSDIYNLAAFNSYVKAQNDLKYSIIEAKNQQKQQYNQYKAEWEAGYKSDSANAYNTALSIYDGTNIDSVRTQLANHGYSEDVINSVLNMISGLDVSTLPTIKAQMEQDNADVDGAFQAWAQSYKQEDKDKIANYYKAMGWSEEKVNKLTTQLDAYAGVAGTEEEEKKTVDQLVATVKSQDAFKDYKGSESEKLAVKNYLVSLGYGDYYEQVIEGLGTAFGAEAEAVVTDVLNGTVGEVTTDSMISALDEVAKAYGKDSDVYKGNQEEVSAKILNTIAWAAEKDTQGDYKRLDDSATAEILGLNVEEWEAGDEKSRRGSVVALAGELYSDGYLTFDDYKTVVEDWIGERTDEIIKEDNKNWRATGMKYAGEVANDLYVWYKAGYMNETEYDDFMDILIADMEFNLDGNVIDWYETVPGAEGTVTSKPVVLLGDQITGDEKVDLLDYHNELNDDEIIENGRWDIFAYNGELYIHEPADIKTWGGEGVYRLYPNDVRLGDDGVGIANDKQKRGEYEIIVRLLENKHSGVSGTEQ